VKLRRPDLRPATVTYSRSDLIAVAVIGAVVASWASIAAGAFSFGALLACEVAFFGLYLVGSLFAASTSLSAGVLFELPLRLLVGYAALNTAVLVLALISPFGLIANFAILILIAASIFFSARERKALPAERVSLVAVGLCVLATCLWCQDSIRPTSPQGNGVLFKPWVDGFYHAVHLRLFGASHGAWTIEDFRMAEVPARLYHYGVYLLPAFIKQASGIHSYAAFAGILVPVGVLFTGLAAYAFFASLWGRWPGLTASAALLLLPDGAQQGLGNTFFSYHFLTQISPSATYGLALLAVAWLFVIQGCLRGSHLQLVAGWLTFAIIGVYKLHYVIASAPLILFLPPLFFRAELGARKRAAWAAATLACFVAALLLAARVPGIPPIRFDASSAGEILHLVQTFATRGAIKDFFIQRMGADFAWTSNLLFGIPYVLLSSLGAYVLLLAVLVLRMRRQVPLLHVLFPLLLIANFLVMFFGLALDFTRSTPDELSHRPVMVVYFFVVTWVGGTLGAMLEGSRIPSRIARGAVLALSVVLLVVPARFGKGVQTLEAMSRTSPVRVPASLLQVASYLRDHGSTEDVFQDSQFDRIYVIGAMAERRPFVSHTMTTIPFRADLVAARTSAIDRLMVMRDPKLVVATARTFGLRWFILHRGNRVNWPPGELRPVLRAGPFTLYEF
jgi:hypothetical protein